MKILRVSPRAKKLVLALGVVAWAMPMSNAALSDSHGYDADAVETAQEATDSLISALLAAVVDVTTRTTPETVVPESQVISLLLANSKKAYRLLDGTGDPIRNRNRPKGKFERDALEAALLGETTQEVKGNKLRTVIPLPFAAENCALCHANYLDYEVGDIIGAITLRVPLLKDDDDD